MSVNACLIGLQGTIWLTWWIALHTDVPNYPVWLGRLTHLLREAQSHWPPFSLHSQLCKTTLALITKKNWDGKKLRRIVPMKTRPFSAGVNLWSYWNYTIFKNGGQSLVRALRCHQGSPQPNVWHKPFTQQSQNICITFIQCWTNVEE